MDLYASILPSVKFMIYWHYVPRKIRNFIKKHQLLPESINMLREIYGMKKRENSTNYTMYGRTIRKLKIIEKISTKLMNDLYRPKSKKEQEKADEDLINMTARTLQMPIKLGYDMWSMMLIWISSMITGIEKSPDGNSYFVNNEGIFFDLIYENLESLPKGLKNPNMLKNIELSTRIFENFDVDHQAILVEKVINKKFRMKRLKDQVVPTLSHPGIFESWLTIFGNFKMNDFFKVVMQEYRAGCKGPYFDHLKVKAKMLSSLVKRLSEIDGFSIFVIGDDCCESNGPMLPPKIYKDFFAVHTKKIVDEAHKHDMKILFHTDGNLQVGGTEDPKKKWELLNIILETGVDALHPIEMLVNDIEEIKTTFGNKICLCNGIDTSVLETGNCKAVGKTTLNILEKVYRGGGNRIDSFIAGSDNSLFAGIKIENVKQMLFTIDEYSKKIL